MSKIYEALNKANPEPEPEKEKGTGREAETELALRGSGKNHLSEQLRGVWNQYETLHSSLGKALGGIVGKAVVFSSSIEGEGTSTVVAEYGASLGPSKEKGTLMVDANLRSPRLHEFFGVPNETGLADVLNGSQDLASAAARIGDEQFFLLPSGVTSTTPGALITVTRFSRFLAEARKRYALVLIDAPPIIPFAETPLIASIADGLVLIIESERTKREIVNRAKMAVLEAGGSVIGVVLNQRRYVIPEFLYRYL